MGKGSESDDSFFEEDSGKYTDRLKHHEDIFNTTKFNPEANGRMKRSVPWNLPRRPMTKKSVFIT